MRKGKNGIRRIAALACSVALLATMLPAQVLAADEATSEPLAAVTSLEESGEEKAPEQGETGIQPEAENACTKSEDCAAETHEDGCPKYVAPAEEEDTNPVVSCTKGEDCAAETHEEGCPKVVSCTKSEDCAAETHEEGCPKYVVPEDNSPAEDNTVPEEPTDNNEKKTTPDEALLTVTPAEVTVSNETELREAIANAGTDATTITVNGTIELTSAIQIEGNKNLVLQGMDGSATITFAADLVVPSEEQAAKDFAMFQVADGAQATITLKNIVLDGAGKARLILLGTYNTLFIEDGAVLQNGYAYKPESASIGNSGGAVRVLDYSKLIMNGGQIQNCQATRYAGGIFGWATGVTIEMNGGLIVNNEGYYAGGIVLLGNSNLYLKSGIITGNNGDDNHGGGVFVNGDTHCYLSGDIKIYGNRRTNISDTNVTYDIYINSNSNFSNSNFVTLTGPFTGLVTICRLNDHLANTKREGLAYVCGTEDYQITAEDASRINILLANQALSLENNQLVVRASDQVVKVLFNANDGTSTPAVITRNMVKDTATTLPANVFEREGYTFMGWNTNEDGTGTKYNNGAQVTFGTDITLYAQWIKTPTLTDSEIQMFTDTALSVAELPGATLSNLTTEDTDIVAISNLELTPKEVDQTATIAAVMTYNGYSFPVSFEVKTVPMNITFGTGTGENPGGTITYQYNGGQAPAFSQFATFYPASISDGSVSPVVGSSAVTLVEGKDIVFNYDAGAGSNDYEYLPLNVTSEANTEKGLPVTVKLLNENYRFVTASNVTPGTELRLSVVVTDENLTESALTGLGTPTLTFTYDGTGKAAVTGLTGISADNISEFTLHFHAWHGTEFAEQHLTGKASAFTEEAVAKIAPTEPGSYLMILTGVSENHYAYQSWIMTINKATVTITAADKTVIKGDTDGLPSLNDLTEGKDYTVTGLAAGHSLTTAPTLNYSEDANVDAVATYSIIPSGAAADEKYYTLQYVNGTLHVEKIAIIEGANQTWTKESGKDLVIRSNADFSDFLGVTVNDVELVQNQDYTAKSGSTIVTIKADYLNSLAAGDYKIAIVSDTGSAVTKFTVKAEAAGDSDTSNNDNTAGGNTGSTTTQSGSGIVYYTCPACGYHDWTAGADGYKCNHCGYVESVKQLSGYGNVKGVYEPKTSAAAAQSASATSSSAIPQTSDAMPVGLLGGVTVVAAAAFAALFVLRKRKHND